MLKKDIQNAANEALKSKEQFTLEVLRMLLAAVSTKEKDKKFKEKLEGDAVLSDEELIDVISSGIKKRRDAIVLYTQGKRPELAEKEQKEIDILQKYLPEQLSEEALKDLVKKAIEKTGAKEMKDMGKIMQELMPQTKGKAEGSVVSRIIKETLGK